MAGQRQYKAFSGVKLAYALISTATGPSFHITKSSSIPSTTVSYTLTFFGTFTTSPASPRFCGFAYVKT
ncbi:hypothetical protein DPSP01_008033 [Paraphaeosphaeria sporulosa]